MEDLGNAGPRFRTWTGAQLDLWSWHHKTRISGSESRGKGPNPPSMKHEKDLLAAGHVVTIGGFKASSCSPMLFLHALP